MEKVSELWLWSDGVVIFYKGIVVVYVLQLFAAPLYISLI